MSIATVLSTMLRRCRIVEGFARDRIDSRRRSGSSVLARRARLALASAAISAGIGLSITPAFADTPLSGVSAISTGVDHSCAVTATGGVLCWGDNSAGQLGDGTKTYSKTPVDVSGLTSGAAAVTTGSERTCALTTAGGVLCWGSAPLGNGTEESSPTPVAVTGLSSGVWAISAGDGHVCALTTAGGVKCWGGPGLVGDGSFQPAWTPVDVTDLTFGVTAIAAGGFHTCALTATNVKCWGRNNNGQLGNGGWDDALTPVAVSDLTSGVVTIAAGGDHSCALTTAGGIKCWGENRFGQLGDNSTTMRLVPTAVSGLSSGVTAIDLGHWHTCALISGGGTKCWGLNSNGQLGDGTNTPRLTPTVVDGLTPGVAAIAGGAFHTCALAAAGTVQCWGDNGSGQLGDGSPAARSLTPVAVDDPSRDITTMAAGDNHTCALTVDGHVKCWGSSRYSQYDRTSGSSASLTPVEVGGFGLPVSAIAAGTAHTCALTSGGSAMCWGHNEYGQLGASTPYYESTTPVTVSGLGSGVAAVATGDRHSCAVTSSGGAMCWGNNEWGQLGAAIPPDHENWMPLAVNSLDSGVAAIAAGERHTCALTTAAGVKCWGNGNAEPATVADLTSGVAAIAAYGDRTCALTTSGGVKCWSNENPVPTVVGDLTSGVAAIVVGYMHSCALTTAGGMKCWGYNYSGQLGNGTTNPSATPITVNGMDSGVTAMAAGWQHTCAVVGGAATCWGRNYWGQLGNGEAGFSNTPRTVRSGALAFTLVPSFNPSYFGQAITFTATLRSPGAATAPTGTVAFMDGAGAVSGCGSLNLSNGRAQCVVSTLAVGSHAMTAVYSGDPNFEAGTSTLLTQTVSRAATTTTITGRTPDPAPPGTPISVSVNVNVTPPGAGTPTGTILVTGGSASCTISLPGGMSCTLTPTGVGADWLAASYEGDGAFEGSLSAAPVLFAPDPPLSGITRIAAGGFHACVLTTSGGVRCWGNNASGQLGDGTTNASARPVSVSGLRNGVTAIAAGYEHGCSVASGAAKCWGSNSQGQLGNGTTAPSLTPVPVSSPGTDFVAVAVGDTHSCALTSTGAVLCWGDNGNGQLGNDTTVPSLTPVAVSGLASGVAAIAAGGAHSCALTATGGVLCWGNNTKGQLGDGSGSPRLVPGAVAGLGSGVIAIAAGSAHTCAIAAGGSAWCWGDNTYGQLGDGTTILSLTPVAISGLSSGATGIAAGLNHSCAVVGGAVMCWGRNDMGQLGVHGPAGSTNPGLTPVVVSGLNSSVAAVAAGRSYTCALTTAGGVQCWGDDASGQLGDGRVSNALSPVPLAVVGLSSRAMKIAAGGAHSCTVGASGDAQCWGRNAEGQVGDGTGIPRPTPVTVSGLTTGVAAITAGELHTCARTDSGAVKCWGSGPLGDGTYERSLVPVAITGFTTEVASISAGSWFTCAVTSVGGAWCWGENFAGQLGNGNYSTALTPVAVSELGAGVSAIAAGLDHGCALTTSGGVQCWGFYSSTKPLPVDGLSSGVAAIAAGGVNSLPCAVTESGMIRCWYQFGPPWDDAPWSASGIAAVAVGGSHTCALTTGGGVRCWGANGYGQLGDGTISQEGGPVTVRGLSTGVVAIAAGGRHSCALAATGHTYCWGDGADGQLGDEARASATPHTVIASAGSATTTTLASSSNPSFFGQSITLTATVSGPGTPGGTVTFKDGAAVIPGCGGVPLSAGQAQCTTSALAMFDHSITAVYPGDAENAGSTSAVLRQFVDMARVVVSITAHTPNPVGLGSAITVSAQVTAMDPVPMTPTGSIFIEMQDGGGGWDYCEILLPATTCQVTPFEIGTTYLQAYYTGDENFMSGASEMVAHIVTLATPTTTTVQSSLNPAHSGENVTFTATVTGTNPTGPVAFKDGAATISACASVPLVDAKATCTTTFTTLGTHSVTATYSGDGSNLGSTSEPVDITIIAADPAPTVTSLKCADPSPTMADEVHYKLEFSESITGLTSSNLEIAAPGIPHASITNVSGSGASWMVTVNSGWSTGALRLRVKNGDGISDSGGNALTGLPVIGDPCDIDKGGTVLGTGQGQPDAGFGIGGYALFNLQQGVASPGAVAVVSSGKILAVGGIMCNTATGANCTLQLAQYLANGSLDTGFGSGGRTATTIAGINPDLGALIVNGDGTFFVAGSRLAGGASVPFVAKFASNGKAAGSFGTGGVATLSSLTLGSNITGAAVDDSGRVLVTGTRPSTGAPQGMELFIARLTTAGALDGSFGSGGVASFGVSKTSPFDDLGTDLVVQPNGKIVVGGHTYGANGFDFLLLRLNANGGLDKPFGATGVVTTRFAGPAGDNLGRKLALQPDGKIVLVGPVDTGSGTQCGVARFDGDGAPDESFGAHGQVLIPLTQGCLGVTAQSDGKLTVVALDRDVDVTYATYARLLSDGTPDHAFGTDGVLDISSYGPATKVALTPAGKLVSGLVIEDPADGVHKSYVVQLGSQLARATTTKITSIAPSPALTGQPYTVAVTVTSASGTPGGTVFVSDGDGASCTITLSAGSTCVLTSTTKGGKTISASYGGASDYQPSVGTRAQHIDAADTATSLVVSPNPALVGKPVTLTAKVVATSPGGGTPTGTVAFKDGRTTLGTAILSGGTASLQLTPAAGTYDVTANFDATDGDYFKNSKSGTIGLEVQALPTVKLTAKDLTVSQKIGTAKVIVQRSGSKLAGLTVDYATADGTAKAAVDYTETKGTLSFTATETTQTISVPITNRGGRQPDRKFTLTLSAPSGATLGTPSTTTITIHN